MTDELFDKLQIRNGDPVNGVFSHREGMQFYYDPKNVTDDEFIDSLYLLVDLSDCTSFMEKSNWVASERDYADDVSVVADDDNGYVLIEYDWNL